MLNAVIDACTTRCLGDSNRGKKEALVEPCDYPGFLMAHPIVTHEIDISLFRLSSSFF